ncbi:uncharacterized protein LOC130372798 [Gadus chalcogrammus]|uniref:uncharacterized protein LOC130372798 n=1 Tax=Gadus chalcogrammus TaxID=1042646 RepID=UPI0024C4763F|nr:uncharacterized protein LOC130372798 [Gadus chalcogrammus]
MNESEELKEGDKAEEGEVDEIKDGTRRSRNSGGMQEVEVEEEEVFEDAMEEFEDAKEGHGIDAEKDEEVEETKQMDWDEERPVSPGSTVTTLMSCSGHLPPAHQTIRCGDQPAVAPVPRGPVALHGAPVRPAAERHPLPQPGRPRPPGTLRNRDVLTELLTESELYSLSLPATTSLRCRADEDEVDLTTEELLAIPSDGSLPVTKTTAYLTDLRHRSLCRPGNCFSPQPGGSCHSSGPLGGARDRSHAPSPNKWRDEDMDRKCLSRQEVTQLQNSQSAGPVIGADCLSSSHLSASFRDLGTAYYRRSYQPPGHAHSVHCSHLQSPSPILRSHHPLNRIGHAQCCHALYGHANPQQPMDGQLAASPSGFWEKAGSIPHRVPAWLDQLPGRTGAVDERRLLLAGTGHDPKGHAPIGCTNTGHAPMGFTHTGHPHTGPLTQNTPPQDTPTQDTPLGCQLSRT